jgi:hypothetical protein
MFDVEKFLEDVLTRPSERSSLDMIFDVVDRMMSSGEFETIDELLGTIDPRIFPVAVSAGFLSITFVAKDKLTERAALWRRTHNALTNKLGQEDADDILNGLL